MDQSSNEVAVLNKKKARFIKNAGQNCIVMFVLFVVSLLSFGRCPAIWTKGDGGSSFNLNILSTIGVAGGLYALIFIPLRLRTILKLPTAKKVLGLTGGIGLIAHSVIAILIPLSSGSGAVGTAGNVPLARSGVEQWQIDGQVYNVETTYYLRLPEGLQYTVQYPWRFQDSQGPMNDERALKVAFPLMKYAYEKGLYKRFKITKVGQGTITPSRIGVVLFERKGSQTRGYRVALSISGIEKRIGK
ncbi:MAG: hypothetical protein SVT52_04750 [Planctomycetota bacterium]|nr:hypothetical protein [Planctomycetota bacterium]